MHHLGLPIAPHAHDGRLQIGEELGQMTKRRIDNRAILFHVDRDHHHLLVLEGNNFRGTGIRHTLQNVVAYFNLG